MIRELKGNIILGFVVAGSQTKGVVRRVGPRSTRRCLLVVQKTWAASCGKEIQMDGYISWCDPTDGGEKDNGPHTPPLETSHPCLVPQRRPPLVLRTKQHVRRQLHPWIASPIPCIHHSS